MTTYFIRLGILNYEYKELDTYSELHTSRMGINMKESMKATDHTLNIIIQRINAYAVLRPTDEINTFIDNINQIYCKYKVLEAPKVPQPVSY